GAGPRSPVGAGASPGEGGGQAQGAGQEGGAAQALTQRGTNGVRTIVPGSAVPRTSTLTGAPSSSAGGTKARAMPWPRTGEKLPLVTSPTTAPSARTGHSARGGRR